SLVELLGLLEEDPVLAHLLVVDSLSVSARVLERRARVLAELAESVDGGRAGARSDDAIARLSTEGAIGGVLAVLHARIARRTEKSLMDLAGPLTSMLVLPHEGPAAAKRELRRPAPPVARARGAVQADPFRAAGIRLTYRTARVLGAIADCPGSSNTPVASL